MHRHFHILLSLLSLFSTSSNKPAPPVLVLLTKADLVPSTSSSSTTSSTPSSPASTASSHLALDRAKQLLLRELERRRLASSGAGSASALKGASGAPLSAGARLDGLEAIPSGGSGSSAGKGPWAALLGALGLGSSSSSTGGIGALEPSSSGAGGAGGAGLPSDESEALALAADDVFAFEGAASWDKLERAVGVELRWAVASVRGGEGKAKGGKEGKGVEEVWEWVEGL